MSVAKTFLLSLLLSLIVMRFWIAFLREKRIGQPIREEGNKEHYKKAGTPTMGGVAFTVLFLVLAPILGGFTPKAAVVLLSTLGFGLIGFLDDYRKVKKKENEGLTPRQKLVLQSGLALLIVIFYFLLDDSAGVQIIPFFNYSLRLSFFWIPILVFLSVGTVNAVNLTDGLDGLCAGVSIPSFLSIAFLSMQDTALLSQSVIFAGLLLGYLVYNAYPASVMMGDTGSLAIGGAVCALMLFTGNFLYLILIGGVYLMEALSVMIQVAYFKRTGGKRIFRMSPIHHHFELEGYSEQKITTAFTVLSCVLCLLALVLVGW